MTGDFSFVFFSLLKSCIGAGILTYPFIFRLYGTITATAYTLLSATAAFIGCSLFIDLNEKRKKNCTMANVSQNAPPWLNFCVSLVVIAKCYVTTMIYVLILKDIIRELVFRVIQSNLAFYTVFALVWCLVSYLCLNDNIRSFKGLSFIGIIGVAVLYSGAYYMSLGRSFKIPHTTNNYNIIDNLTFLTFSFNCHHSLFGVFNACSISPFRMKSYLAFVFATAALIYLAFGYINCKFLLFPDKIVLSSWPTSTVYYVVLFCYSIIIISSIILQLYPIGEQISALSKGRIRHAYALCIVNTSIIILVLSNTITPSTSIKRLSGPFSTIMCFILPPLFMYLEKKRLSILHHGMCLSSLVYAILCFVGIFKTS